LLNVMQPSAATLKRAPNFLLPDFWLYDLGAVGYVREFSIEGMGIDRLRLAW